MLVVTFSDARKKFSSILDRARKDGAVLIKRADGTCFRIVPEMISESPLDVLALDISLKPGELAAALEEARERTGV
jgi:antitoxin (DNA-binding transcriptional repressor) of toxin-antitoxin stability system